MMQKSKLRWFSYWIITWPCELQDQSPAFPGYASSLSLVAAQLIKVLSHNLHDMIAAQHALQCLAEAGVALAARSYAHGTHVSMHVDTAAPVLSGPAMALSAGTVPCFIHFMDDSLFVVTNDSYMFQPNALDCNRYRVCKLSC